MSEQYPGGFITKSPPTPSGPYANSSATGLWNLSQQAAYKQQGLWPTQGNASPDSFIENLFSTYLYTGNGSTQTITNGINLSTNGGMVWLKDRSSGQSHALSDTVRGVGSSKQLQSNTTSAGTTDTLTGFTASGFTLDASFGLGAQNLNTVTYASWTFREQPKFFDIVTYTGTGNIDTLVPHNLGSVPAVIMIKCTSATTDWIVRTTVIDGSNDVLILNKTDAKFDSGISISPTSTTFTTGGGSGDGGLGQTYVAYLFASNAGGFGASGAENVITCGSYVGNGSTNGPTVTLGYEPQWILVKNTTSAADWWIVDIIRGMPVASSAGNGFDWRLRPNTSDADNNGDPFFAPTPTGFKLESLSSNTNASGNTYLYIAIRRGPMAVPTDATKVFTPIARNGTTSVATVTTTNLPDSIWSMNRAGATGYPAFFYDRLRGANTFLINNGTSGEVYDVANSNRFSVTAFNNLTYTLGVDSNYAGINGFTSGYVNWVMSRAPGFFDTVCYSGSGSSPQVINHNLTVTPEMMIVKYRDGSTNFYVYHSDLGNTKAIYLDGVGTPSTSAVFWNNTSPTSTQFTVGSFPSGSGAYVTYLFATCPGVSKVGSYTGTGTTQVINCGFTAGSRFIMIRRTDSTGDWYIWDSVRGIVAGNDPYLLVNSSAAEVTNTDYVDTAASGFEISSTAPSAINANGGTFIFLAIA